jgi:alkanesulfonate monooxygenase SsuD/methylene tetrahydromethanopterin reductase-like flavin-dependent oxidoreductase (luciferase family)
LTPTAAASTLLEEIGMLDHLTGGRLEIGTAAGIPNEMAKVGPEPDEARARNDEVLDILDAALKSPVISQHGKFWNFDNLHLTPRPQQQPAPPVWVTVVSASSARKAARRRQATHRLSSVEQDRRDLRCVSRRGSQDRSERRA